MDLDHADAPSEHAQIDQYEWLLGASRYAVTAHKDGKRECDGCGDAESEPRILTIQSI